MELDQFRIIKELLTEIRDLLKEQKEKPNQLTKRRRTQTQKLWKNGEKKIQKK